MKPGINFFAHLHPVMRHIDLFVLARGTDSQALAQPVTFKTLTDDELHRGWDAPMLQIDQHAAQQLMDSLWTCGLRPSEGTGSAGQLAATQRHLDDMRKLVFEGSGS